MDAVEFVIQQKRMCLKYKQCKNCPLLPIGLSPVCMRRIQEHPAEAVDIVEKWSKAHPVITRKQKFYEIFNINIIPSNIEWWNDEYVEPYTEEQNDLVWNPGAGGKDKQ